MQFVVFSVCNVYVYMYMYLLHDQMYASSDVSGIINMIPFGEIRKQGTHDPVS